MADYTLSTIVELISHRLVTHPGQAIGADRTPAAGSIFARIWFRHALHEATANTNPGSFRIQTRPLAGDDQWVTVQEIGTSRGTAATTDITGTEAAGETTLAVTDQSIVAGNDEIYIDDATADADGEWALVQQIAANVIQIVDGLTNAKASGDDIWTLAETTEWILPLVGVLVYRVIYLHHGATGADTAVHVNCIEATDFE